MVNLSKKQKRVIDKIHDKLSIKLNLIYTIYIEIIYIGGAKYVRKTIGINRFFK